MWNPLTFASILTCITECFKVKFVNSRTSYEWRVVYYPHMPPSSIESYYQTTTNKTQETNNTLALSGDSSRGKAIGFAQFKGRKFYREIPDGFSIFGSLVNRKKPVVLPCPPCPIVIWVTVWGSGILSKSVLTF